ncbi:Trm112p-domain-containing protein [Lactarius akahatsu]|uniref:Trm112p-domain-containing protein n=1 Tax=Lactarius akahatsu TaxID=416441 RepID=A0AAD4LKD5_9AGAM|nr:Trm112p-domain-containing protein [Lactarius akahatsu]
MVRLITHNLLACHAKGCTTNNYPLKFSNVKLALREADFNPDFLRGFLPRIEWDALVQASRERCSTTDLLKQLHHVLLETHIDEGSMTCPNCGHVYPISNGIPNMLLAEHEIG